MPSMRVTSITPDRLTIRIDTAPPLVTAAVLISLLSSVGVTCVAWFGLWGVWDVWAGGGIPHDLSLALVSLAIVGFILLSLALLLAGLWMVIHHVFGHGIVEIDTAKDLLTWRHLFLERILKQGQDPLAGRPEGIALQVKRVRWGRDPCEVVAHWNGRSVALSCRSTREAAAADAQAIASFFGVPLSDETDGQSEI